MRTPHFLGISLAVVLFGIGSLGSSPVWATGFNFFKDDQSVCYHVYHGDFQTFTYIRLNVKKHSPLTTLKEKFKLKHPIQTTYSAIGKKVSDSPIFAEGANEIRPTEFVQISTTNGSVIATKGHGSRMGLTNIDNLNFITSNTSEDSIRTTFGGNIEFLECASKESSATPKRWELCSSVNIRQSVGAQETFAPGDINLRRVDPLKHPLCSSFSAFPQVSR